MTGGTAEAERGQRPPGRGRRRARRRARRSAPGARCSTTPALLRTYRPARRGAPAAAAGQPRRASQLARPAAAERAERARRPARRRRADRPPQPDPGGGPARGRAATSPACSSGIAAPSRGWRRGRSSSRRSASGWTAPTCALLRDAGVAAVDVAGAGGTNWALIEGRRDPRAGARRGGVRRLGRADRRRAARRAGRRAAACRSSPRAACATASTSRSASRSAPPPPAWPRRSCAPRRPTARARRSARCVEPAARSPTWAAGAPAAAALGRGSTCG